jgi:hypothetical protein
MRLFNIGFVGVFVSVDCDVMVLCRTLPSFHDLSTPAMVPVRWMVNHTSIFVSIVCAH